MPWLSVIDLNQVVFTFAAKIGEKRLNQNTDLQLLKYDYRDLGHGCRQKLIGKDAVGRMRWKKKEKAVS